VEAAYRQLKAKVSVISRRSIYGGMIRKMRGTVLFIYGRDGVVGEFDEATNDIGVVM
jgi:hypothetical protein